MALPLKALRQADDQPRLRAAHRAQPAGGLAQGLGGTGQKRHLGPLKPRSQVRGDPQIVRKGDARQVLRIFARRGDRRGLLGAPGNEGDIVPVAREVQGESGAPGAGANDREIHMR